MIERVVEHWLTNVNERQYQFPFCHVLLSRGFRLLHISSHGPQEQGKDIIALDADDQPIAFQLKTGNIDLATLRKIHGELVELVEVPIQFPGLPPASHHRSVLVTNGMLNDTARQSLDGFIRGWERRGFPPMRVEPRDSLLRDFVDLHGRYLPAQLSDVEQLLRFYTCDGSGPLPRGQFAEFVLRNIPLGELPKRFVPRQSRRTIKRVKTPTKEVARHLASTALLTSYALYPFTVKKNHWAEFEGWVIFSAHVLAVAERLELPDAAWVSTYEISFLAARTALAELVSEATKREQWLEGDVIVDSQVYRARMTIVIGLMALYSILCRLRREENVFESDIYTFIKQHLTELHVWGETASPYLVLLALCLEQRGEANTGEAILGGLLSGLLQRNKPRSETDPDIALSDPYLEVSDALAWNSGIRRGPAWERQSYDGQAYGLRAVVMLLARRLRRQLLASNWYGITDVSFIEMYPAETWGMLLWRFPIGDLRITLSERPQSWVKLLEAARNIKTDDIPAQLRARPDFLAALITVFPHRLRADTLKVIEDAV